MTGSDETSPRVVAVNRGTEQAEGPGSSRDPRHEALEAWVGKWINQGHIVNDDGTAGPTITTSDVYEWVPGRFFVVHSAYGQIGDFGVGGVEMIGFDEGSGE